MGFQTGHSVQNYAVRDQPAAPGDGTVNVCMTNIAAC